MSESFRYVAGSVGTEGQQGTNRMGPTFFLILLAAAAGVITAAGLANVATTIHRWNRQPSQHSRELQFLAETTLELSRQRAGRTPHPPVPPSTLLQKNQPCTVGTYGHPHAITANGGQSGCNAVGGRGQLPAHVALVPAAPAPEVVHPVHGVVPTVAQRLPTVPAGCSDCGSGYLDMRPGEPCPSCTQPMEANAVAFNRWLEVNA